MQSLYFVTTSLNAPGLQVTAKSLSEVARRTREQASGAEAASEEASQSVRAVATAAEQLSLSIDEISAQIGQTSS